MLESARDLQWQIGTARDMLHCLRLTKTTTTTPHLNNIKLKAALTLTPDNCRTNRLLYSLIHTGSTKLN
ncbi:hypothetical protein HBI29_242310 [Parastagonospora nodorum]|nr:hypothetical protein HBI29_242310 [Parastagonospora nodorum]